ncbi:hypothetical protein YC2023_004989 [Brassica napus]
MVEYIYGTENKDNINHFTILVIEQINLKGCIIKDFPLQTSLQCRKIHASPKTAFSCSQNLLIEFFNVDFDFNAFFQMHAQKDYK